MFIDQPSPAGEPRVELTDEERAVLEAAIVGYRADVIAKQLRIGVRTAERRLAEAFAKLGVRNLADAARLWAPPGGLPTLLDAAFRASPAAMLVGGPDGRIVAANDAFCRLLGYPEGELLGRPCSAVTHPADVAADYELRLQLRPGEAARHVRKRFVGRDGTEIVVDLFVTMGAVGLAVGHVVPATPADGPPRPQSF